MNFWHIFVALSRTSRTTRQLVIIATIHSSTLILLLAIFLVLLNKGALDQKFYERVTAFKKDRNLVLHNVESHYNLILNDPKKFNTLKTQEDFDAAAIKAAQGSLGNAHQIFMDFFKKFHEINGHVEDFFKIPLVKGGKPIDRGPSAPRKTP